jgi:predicted regulator of Ras-like GTPase activity (Roadblock/LC7/MglB family)
MRNDTRRLRLATAHVAGVQAGVTDGVLVAQPCEETLETETVAAVGGGAVSVKLR